MIQIHLMKLVINESDSIHEICVNETYAINDYLMIQLLLMKHVINDVDLLNDFSNDTDPIHETCDK